MTTGYIEDLQSLGTLGAQLIAGSFRTNAASAIDATLSRGAGWSVARTSEGLFTVTLDRAYVGLISGWVQLQKTDIGAASVGRLVAEFGDIDVVTNRTVVIRIKDVYGSTAGTAEVEDMASNANNKILFGLILKFGTTRDATGF